MSPRVASSPRYSSAGGQDEHPCEVKSSTTTGEPAGRRRRGETRGDRECDDRGERQNSQPAHMSGHLDPVTDLGVVPLDDCNRTSRDRRTPVTRHHLDVTPVITGV